MATAFQTGAFQLDAFQIEGGVEVWPAESDVRVGIAYGPTGIEYVGSLQVGASGIFFDVDTGSFFKHIKDQVILRL